MAIGQPVLVRKLRPDGSESYRWTGRLLERERDRVVVVARFNGPPGSRAGDVALERSDLFVEFYYFERWFNVFQIYSAAGQLKGWYCNVSTPAQMVNDELVHTDLVLDVMVHPSGEHHVLDRHDYQERSKAFPPALVQGAETGLDDLLDLARRRVLPSWSFEQAAAVDETADDSR